MPALQTIFSDIATLRYNAATLDVIHADFAATAGFANMRTGTSQTSFVKPVFAYRTYPFVTRAAMKR